MTKLKTLSNFDLDDIYKNENKYGGTYTKDNLPYKDIKRNKFYIINLDNKDGQGTHWTCVIQKNDYVLYIDSFGAPPPLQVIAFTHKYKRNRYYNIMQLQHFDSNLCGYYCIYFIHMMVFEDHDFLDLLNNFSTNTRENDAYLTKYFTTEYHGNGFITDFVRKIFSTAPRNEFPPAVRNLIKQYGDLTISGITVCRTPVIGILQKLMNFLSFGMMKERLRKYNYDQLYHLYMVIKLSNGTTFRLEKNHVINMEIMQPTMTKYMECRGVNMMNQSITLNNFLLNTIQYMGNRYFVYDSIRANCQDYVLSHIQANKFITDFGFIKQNTDDLIPKYLEYFNRFVTDTASRGDVLLNGRNIFNN